MGQFNRDRNSGGRSFGGGGGFRERPQMHPATCSNCGNACEVPFKPTGSKPVLCNNCFRANGPERSFGNSQDRRDDRRSFDKPRFDKPRFDKPAVTDYKAQFESLNHKLDKILGILMAATEKQVPAKTKEKIVEAMTEVKVEKKAPKKKAEKKEPAVVEEEVITEKVAPKPVPEEPTQA